MRAKLTRSIDQDGDYFAPVRNAISQAFRMIDFEGASREDAIQFVYQQLIDEDQDTIVEAIMKVGILLPEEGHQKFEELRADHLKRR